MAAKKKELKEVVIKRSRWHWNTEGRVCFESALRLENGKQCCLGFLCRAEGYKAKEIIGVGFPSGLVGLRSTVPFPAILLGDLEKKITLVNDGPAKSEPAREKKIARLFKRAGYLATFVD